DGADKNNPTLITDDIRTHGLVHDIFYDDQLQRLYLACVEGGFEIWNVENPAQPENMSRMEILYFGVETPVGHVQVKDNYAVLECDFGGVHTVDISDPYNPVQVTFNGEMGNPAHNIHLGTDGRIHATGAQFYVRLNINPDGTISNTGEKEFIYGAGAVFGMDDIAFVAYNPYMYILDLTLPGFPAWSITDVGSIGHIEVRNGYAFITNDNGFYVWDVSNVQNPVLQFSYPAPFDFDELYIAGNYAYIGVGPKGLQIFDISNPVNPVPLGKYDTFGVGLGLCIDGNLAYLADAEDGLVIIDKSNLDYPQLVGHYPIPDGFCYQVEVQNNIAYTACWTSGFRVIDVSNPSSPVELAVDTSYDVWKLDVDGNYAYVVEAIANAESYVHIYDITNPSNPVEVSSTQFPTTVYEVFYDESYLYVANYTNGLRILDVSNPSNPVEVAFMDYPDVFDIDIKGNILYLCAPGIAQPNGGFFTVDITNPQNPVELDMYADPGFACFTVKVEGYYAYITDGDYIHLIDVSSPTSLLYLEEYIMSDLAYDTHPVGNLIYVANAEAGLQILSNNLVVPVELSNTTIPVGYMLAQNYPNPFNPSTTIQYSIPERTDVKLTVVNIVGEEVAVLVNRTLDAGNYSVEFNAANLPSGVYLYRLQAGDFVTSRKMILLK
ncbi:MAG: T9SS type A sorting domain-containing protein, partial [Ignavibacteriaceae bacterium]|nr:T9SS type A sorting domain-containing protein [Ignavibacteriaceae bacterium]